MDSGVSQGRRGALVWSLLPWCSSQRVLPILLQKSGSNAKIWVISEPFNLVCCEVRPLSQTWQWTSYLSKISLCFPLPVLSLVFLLYWQVLGAGKQLLPFSLGLFQWCWWDGQHCCLSGETPLWHTSKLRELVVKILAPWTGSECSPS